jgi:3-dehydroquinate dehydratase-1
MVVGVISSPAELDFAIRIAKPPHLFELRLDHLLRPTLEGAIAARLIERLEITISKLREPLIITARHPMEGGANRLSAQQRRNLLYRFLHRARYIDIELRSAPFFGSLLRAARKQKVRRIISVHHLMATPPPSRLWAQARAARMYEADIFKVATRTDTPAQLARLMDFAAAKVVNIPVSAMGIGKLGMASRLLLVSFGSPLVYVSLGHGKVEGQITLEQLRAYGFALPL